MTAESGLGAPIRENPRCSSFLLLARTFSIRCSNVCRVYRLVSNFFPPFETLLEKMLELVKRGRLAWPDRCCSSCLVTRSKHVRSQSNGPLLLRAILFYSTISLIFTNDNMREDCTHKLREKGRSTWKYSFESILSSKSLKGGVCMTFLKSQWKMGIHWKDSA